LRSPRDCDGGIDMGGASRGKTAQHQAGIDRRPISHGLGARLDRQAIDVERV
jgi:hypothetical protein